MKNFNLVMEIMGLSVLINENTEYCTFVDFSGHVKQITIRVFGSKDSGKYLSRTEVHYDPIETDYKSEEKILSELREVKEMLINYLYGSEINSLKEMKPENEKPTAAATDVGQ